METPSPSIEKSRATKQANADLSILLSEFKDYATFIIDSQGLVVSWHEGAGNMYGYTAKEVLGQHISFFYTPLEIEQNVPGKHLQQAKESGRFEHEEVKYKKDGKSFYAHTVITRLCHPDGSIKGYGTITRDITIPKLLEEENRNLTNKLEEKVNQRTKELEIVNKELEAFSYSVSHDLRAPLRAVSGYSIMLKEDYEGKIDSEADRIINVIVSNARMMSQLIDDLLSFSKMARLEVVNQSVNMKELANKCVAEILQSEQQTPTVIINDMPTCKGDASMLKQVWFNLLANAIKYSGKKNNPVIEAGMIDNEKSNIYYVKDNGTGFSMKYYDKLFGVFQRLHRNDEFEGTGLGLALAKRIISKHGGEIWGEASLNEGATFYFSIPK